MGTLPQAFFVRKMSPILLEAFNCLKRFSQKNVPPHIAGSLQLVGTLLKAVLLLQKTAPRFGDEVQAARSAAQNFWLNLISNSGH